MTMLDETEERLLKHPNDGLPGTWVGWRRISSKETPTPPMQNPKPISLMAIFGYIGITFLILIGVLFIFLDFL